MHSMSKNTSKINTDLKFEIVQIFANRSFNDINSLLSHLNSQELQGVKALIKGAVGSQPIETILDQIIENRRPS